MSFQGQVWLPSGGLVVSDQKTVIIAGASAMGLKNPQTVKMLD